MTRDGGVDLVVVVDTPIGLVDERGALVDPVSVLAVVDVVELAAGSVPAVVCAA